MCIPGQRIGLRQLWNCLGSNSKDSRFPSEEHLVHVGWPLLTESLQGSWFVRGQAWPLWPQERNCSWQILQGKSVSIFSDPMKHGILFTLGHSSERPEELVSATLLGTIATRNLYCIALQIMVERNSLRSEVIWWSPSFFAWLKPLTHHNTTQREGSHIQQRERLQSELNITSIIIKASHNTVCQARITSPGNRVGCRQRSWLLSIIEG